ncbi:hypothetical protein K435DRAFT_790842 [Dendrothele bispora CBS 962.96]|uniref:DUF6532 domain-containing protein n=1 Tax=Dendrothele bispora (strain CBS 962.96) TaxID=1314807 RepID=A0A4V4HHZ3_DENBC|nr:hypothetical protein K435DRAFT_790842 [Dendrothele bispora CBS 962.96]
MMEPTATLTAHIVNEQSAPEELAPPAKRARAKAVPPASVRTRSSSASIKSSSHSSLKPKTSAQVAKSLAKSASKTTRKHRAPSINIEDSSSDEAGLEPPTKQPKRRSNVNVDAAIMSKDDNEDEEAEDSPIDLDVDMESEDRSLDKDAGRYLEDEAPCFTSKGKAVGGKKKSQRIESPVIDDNDHRSHASSIGVGSASPTSDTEDVLSSLGDDAKSDADEQTSGSSDMDDENGELEEEAPSKIITEKAAKKLREELPVVSKKSLLTSKAAANKVNTYTTKSKQAVVTSGDTNNSESTLDWGIRTNIVLEPHKESTRSYKLALKGQNSDIRAVIDRARVVGVFMLVSDTKKCPVSKNLKSIALNALITAADELGYGDQGDIADRLEQGDILKYIKPLAKYTAGRISLERKLLKSPVSTVLTALGLDNSPQGVAAAAALVRAGDYIYPKTSAGHYDYQSPFMNEVIHKYMSDLFWGNNKFARLLDPFRPRLFVSLLPNSAKTKLELEVPKAMVATAACAIHAILLDHSLGTVAKFPPVGLHRQWKGYIDLLEEMETKNKSRAHKIMHGLYLKASHSVAPATHGLSEEQIIGRVNWAAFEEDIDSDGSEEQLNESAGGKNVEDRQPALELENGF